MMKSTYLVLMFQFSKYDLGHPAWAFMGTWNGNIPEVYKFQRISGRTDYAKLAVL